MEMNVREIWTVVHGMLFGFIFLLGFSGALYAVYSLKSEWLTTDGINKTVNIVKVYLIVRGPDRHLSSCLASAQGQLTNLAQAEVPQKTDPIANRHYRS